MAKKTLPLLLLGVAGLFGNVAVSPEANAQNVSLQLSAYNLDNQPITTVNRGDQIYLVLSGSNLPSTLTDWNSHLQFGDSTKVIDSGLSQSGTGFNNVPGGNVTSPVSLGNVFQSGIDNTFSINQLSNAFDFTTVNTMIAPNDPFASLSNGEIAKYKVSFPSDDPLGTYSINFVFADMHDNLSNRYFYFDSEDRNINVQNLQIAVVPEKSTYAAIMGAAGLGAALYFRRKRKDSQDSDAIDLDLGSDGVYAPRFSSSAQGGNKLEQTVTATRGN